MAKLTLQIIMIYLNALSITSLQDLIDNQSSLKESLVFLNFIPQKFLLCVPYNNPNFIIERNISFKNALMQINDIDLKTLLTTILANSTMYLGEYPRDYIHQSKNTPFNAFEIYLSRCENDNIILSLHSEDVWKDNTVRLVNGSNVYEYKNCPKTSNDNFGDLINTWEPIIKYAISKSIKQDGYLCHAKSIREIIPTSIHNKYNEQFNDPATKISNIRIMAKLIAECCDYEYSHDVSQRNRNDAVIRDIYYNAVADKYISTDINHGRFEVLDSDGEHICEIDFDGNQTKPKDKSRLHNIII